MDVSVCVADDRVDSCEDPSKVTPSHDLSPWNPLQEVGSGSWKGERGGDSLWGHEFRRREQAEARLDLDSPRPLVRMRGHSTTRGSP